MTRALVLLCLLSTGLAHADDNPKRKVAVLEYRAGSSSLVGIGTQIATEIGKSTSLTVLGPAQARTVYGEQLDQVIVKCAGEPDCVAKIGAKLGVAEVILVGVSELGDVILTIQRIDVATHAVSARITDSLGDKTVPATEQVWDYVGRLLPPTDFLRYGVIEIVASQPGALVTVGGEARGTTPIAPLKLRAPATYPIKVEKSGFVPFTTKVQLPPDGELKVDAMLSRKTGKSWYQHWYVAVGLGVVVAAAAGTTIYFASGGGDDRLEFKGSVE